MFEYYVHMIDDDPVLNYGPYTGTKNEFKRVKSFARIGSQTGGRRVITRGMEGPRVRVYQDGVRTFPVGKGQIQAANLLSWEVPKNPVPKKRNPGWIGNPILDKWSRRDTEPLVEEMAEVIWADTLHTVAMQVAEEYETPNNWIGLVMHQLGEDVPKEAASDARRFLKDFKKANGETSWFHIANNLNVTDEDLDTFAYYIVMQTLGQGVAWSDSRPGELITGYDEATNSYGPAEERVYTLLEEFGEG